MQLQTIWVLISILVLAALSGCTTGDTILIKSEITSTDKNVQLGDDQNNILFSHLNISLAEYLVKVPVINFNNDFFGYNIGLGLINGSLAVGNDSQTGKTSASLSLIDISDLNRGASLEYDFETDQLWIDRDVNMYDIDIPETYHQLIAGKLTSMNNYICDGTTCYKISDLNNTGSYTIAVQSLSSSPADNATNYFGANPRAVITTADRSRVYIPKNGTIKAAYITGYAGTTGTAEPWIMLLRKNNTTDYNITTVAANTNQRVFINAQMNVPVSAGDYFEIKTLNPTWATNPLTSTFGGHIYIE